MEKLIQQVEEEWSWIGRSYVQIAKSAGWNGMSVFVAPVVFAARFVVDVTALPIKATGDVCNLIGDGFNKMFESNEAEKTSEQFIGLARGQHVVAEPIMAKKRTAEQLQAKANARLEEAVRLDAEAAAAPVAV